MELSGAVDVSIVHKASFEDCVVLLALKIYYQVMSSLDLPSFRTVGATVNDTVSSKFPSRSASILTHNKIDWEASQIEERVCVMHGIDPELDEKKKIYNSLSTFLVSGTDLPTILCL